MAIASHFVALSVKCWAEYNNISLLHYTALDLATPVKVVFSDLEVIDKSFMELFLGSIYGKKLLVVLCVQQIFALSWHSCANDTITTFPGFPLLPQNLLALALPLFLWTICSLHQLIIVREGVCMFTTVHNIFVILAAVIDIKLPYPSGDLVTVISVLTTKPVFIYLIYS